MLKSCSLRLFTVSLWMLLSVSTFIGWRHLASLRPEDPPIWQMFTLSDQITGGLTLFSVLMVILSVVYILMISKITQESLNKILIWTITLSLSAILAYPIGTFDLFSNAAYTHLHAYYDLNPYNSIFSDVPGYLCDPFLKNTGYINHETPYGPLWTCVSYGLYKIFGDLGFIPLLFGFKLIGLISHVLNTFIVYNIAEAITHNSGTRAAVIYGTNPLAIFDLVVNAHNDGLAISLFLISIYMIIKGYCYIWPLIAGLAASFKLTPLIAFPFLFWKVIVEKDKRIAIINICSTALVIVFSYYIFFTGENSLSGFITVVSVNAANSLPLLLHSFGLPLLIYKISFILFVLIYAHFLINVSRNSWNGLLVAIGAGFILYYMLGAVTVHQWYFLWPLAILSATKNNIWKSIVILQTIMLLISYIFKIESWGKSLILHYSTYMLVLIPILMYMFLWCYKIYFQKKHFK